MATVRYVDFEERTVCAGDGTRSVLEVSLGAGLGHFHQCNGRARCTTCRVRVLKGAGNLTPRAGEELHIATERGWSDDIRLACQAQVRGDVEVARLIRDEAAAAAVSTVDGPVRRGEEKQLAVMFCDIRGFTKMAAWHLPHDVIHILNRFFQAVCEPVLANRGYLDKYLGDGFLAVFGLDQASPQSACLDAARAALRMPELVEELNRALLSAFDVQLDFGVGLHFGQVVVGDVGHPLKTQFTVLGDTVNVASRIEQLNKKLGTRLLVSTAFYDQVAPFVEVGPPRRTKVANRWETVREVTGLTAADPHQLVRQSFLRIRPEAQRFGALFYEELFRAAPELAALFAKTDMERMREMLLEMVGHAVGRLDNLSALEDSLRALGTRHQAYGVKTENYPIAVRAFSAALARFFGEEKTTALRAGWTDLLRRVTDLMISGSGRDM